MTTIASRLKPEPSTRGRSAAPQPDGDLVALLPIGADLLPRQTAAGRGGRRTRLIAAGLVLVAVLAVAGGWLLAQHARSSAESDLAAAQDRTRSLQVQQRSFDALVTAQTGSRQLQAALGSLMATDTSWSTVLGDLAQARGGVAFTAVQGTVDGPAGSAGGSGSSAAAATTVTTPGAIGHLSITGTAPDKPTVAAFVEALGGITGFADPFLSTVTALTDSSAGAGGYSFTVTVALTGDLRSAVPSRWATTSGGGK